MPRALLVVVFACFRAIPLGLAVRLGCTLGWLARVVVRFRLKVVRTNMAVVFGDSKTPAELAELERRFYRHLGLTLIELLRMPGCDLQELGARIHLHGLEHFETAKAQGKGVLALTGHFGNWEIGLAGPAAHGYPVKTVGKRIKGKTGEMIRHMIRDENGVENIEARNSVRAIIRLMRDNNLLAFPLDQNRIRQEGIFVDFFGVPASTMPALAVLAERTGAQVLPVYCYRDENLRDFHIVVLPVVEMEYPHADKAANQLHNTRRFNAVLEQIILQHPDQWLWIHKRWKARPEHEDPPLVSYR